MLVNKLVTVTLRADEQYSYYIRETDFKMKYLIQVLSLQAITWLKIRLIINNLVLFKKIIFFNNFIRKTMFFNSLIRKSIFFNNLNIKEKKFNILNLIKNT